jgi:hypothetical protein
MHVSYLILFFITLMTYVLHPYTPTRISEAIKVIFKYFWNVLVKNCFHDINT